MQFVLSAVNEITARIRQQIEKNVSVVSAMKVSPGGKKTFAEDEGLPSLPLPELRHTLEGYLESVRPLVSPEMLLKTEAIVKDFEEGVGKELQDKLKQRAASQRNWLERWWEDKAYLENRTPLLPFCIMFGNMNLQEVYPSFESGSMLENAALMLYYLSELWSLLRSERLAPFVERKNVFTMHQFRRLYNCSRIPLPQCDQLHSYFQTESEGSCPSHVIVCCNGHVYQLDVIFEGSQLSPPELQRQLQHIVDDAIAKGPGPGTAALSGDQRDKWAANRSRLEQLSEENKRILKLVDSAILCLILDHTFEPKTQSEVVTVPASSYRNVWADKSCNFLVWGNGQALPFGDHSAYDGTTSVTCTFYVRQNIVENGKRWTGSMAMRDIPTAERLDFTLDQILVQEIARVLEEQAERQENVRISAVIFDDFGKNFLKKHRVHPDTFVQLALQLAYFRVHGKPASCYETATTRAYYHGRTETLRTCRPEVMDWVHAMQSESVQVTEKVELMRAASNKLLALMKEAKDNAGCDRHLFGLYCAALESSTSMPEIFTDPSFSLRPTLYRKHSKDCSEEFFGQLTRYTGSVWDCEENTNTLIMAGGAGNFTLSTSLVGYTPVGGVVAPMCENGYGCFYNILSDSLRFNMSSMRSSPDTDLASLSEELFSAMREMRVFLQDTPVPH